MDMVMMDYLARKMRGGDYGPGNQSGDQGRGNYSISGTYDRAGGDMRYPSQGGMGYPPHRDMGYPMHGDMNYPRVDMGYPMCGDMRGSGDYNYPMDQRQSVKGTGPYGIGGSMYYGRGDRMDNADYTYGGGQRDQHKFKMPKLTKAEKHQWEQSMRNTDGTHGPHYDMAQVVQAAEKVGIRFNEFDEKDLALIMNMFYSDYGQVFRKYGVDKPEFYADIAKAYFDDPDGPDPDDKLSRQYHCMTDHE